MTAISAKKVEGIIGETSPTTITVSKKMIYVPQEKREFIKSLNLEVGDAVRVVYDHDGNLINAERIPQKTITEDLVPASTTETKKKVYIQPIIGIDQITQPEPDKKPDVYIHQPTTPVKNWISGKEKNDSIILQSVLARAVDIVNAQYRDYPEVGYHDHPFEELLDTRINHIENTADRLFIYIKKKVTDEQSKGEQE
jgi:hypothetical protein